MASTFAHAVNNLATTLASAHVAGDGQLVLAPGTGALLGALPANRVWRCTALQNANTSSETVLGIFEATGRTGEALTGVAAIEGTTDVDLPLGTTIQFRVTAKFATDWSTAINTNEAAIATAQADIDAIEADATIVRTTTTYANPTWISSLAGSKVSGDIAGNAASITGSITQSQVTGLPAALTAKADDSAVVHRTGNETVTGSLVVKGVYIAFAANAAIGDATNGNAIAFSSGRVGIGKLTAASQLHVQAPTSTTRPLIVQGATGQTAPLLPFQGVSSTGADRDQGIIDARWVTSTDATRTGRLTASASDWTGTDREGFRVESDGAQAKIGFYGGTAVAKPSGDLATGLVALGLFSSVTVDAADITGDIPQSQVTDLVTDLADKAPLSNPTFTGTVTAPAFVGDGSGLTNLPGGGGGGGSTLIFTQTADKTIANTTTETSLFGTGVGSLTIAAGEMVVGKTYRVKILGNLSISGSTYRARLKLGGVTLFDGGAVTSSIANNQIVEIDALVTCRATGATNTVMGAPVVKMWATSTSIRVAANIAFTLANVDTSISNDIDFTWQFGTAAAGNSITTTNATVEKLNVPS